MKLIAVFLLLESSLILSCRTRPNTLPSSNSEIKATSLSTCDFTVDTIEDHPTNPLLVDEPGALVKTFDQRYDLDTTYNALMATPKQYGDSITVANDKPKKFAAATVLAAMRRLRRFYFTNPFESIERSGIQISVPNSCARTPTEAAAGISYDYKNAPVNDINNTWNTDGVGSMGGNLGVMPGHWMDIQSHFYTMSPHTRHGCWTTFFQGGLCALDPFNKGTKLTTLESRNAIADACSGKKILRDDYMSDCPDTYTALSVVPHHMSVYNLLWVDPITRKFINPPSEQELTSLGLTASFVPKDIAKLPSVVWSEKQRAQGFVNVWDYIMLQRTFAWDWEQQQAVLNEFFGDHKYYATVAEANRSTNPRSSASIDVNDPSDCNKWRKTTPHDPSNGTHCNPNKTMRRSYKAVGR